MLKIQMNLSGKRARKRESARKGINRKPSFLFLYCLPILEAALPATPPPPCSLNGDLQPDGSCVCDLGWSGQVCNNLLLSPSQPLTSNSQTYYHPSIPSASPPFDNSWGISILEDNKVSGLYHGFMTELQNNCSLSSYSSASRILHLTASSPLGPWTVHDVALHSFAHNPQVIRDVDGSILLFHIGNEVPSFCNTTCSGGNPARVNATCSGSSHGASVARAISPYGPWERISFILPDNETNPSAFLLSNGTIIVTARRWTSGVPLYSASSWRGPYLEVLPGERFPVIPVPYSSNDTSFDEDPFLYSNRHGFHMLTHRQPLGVSCSPTATDPYDCRCGGGHMYSEQLTGPWFYDLSLVFNCTLSVLGNPLPIKLHARQRPTLFISSQEGACPVLFTGASNDPSTQYDSSFTMSQSILC